MEEFEFSVDISDRDWECFFAQCEECNVFPPTLAGLEDSGMSDMDDLEALFGKKVQKCEKETWQSEEAVADGPPVCEGSPQELYLGKLHSGGIESVLSGSEEDIHLQSVNMFFEEMKSLSDCQKPAQKNQVGATKNRPVKGELSRNGQSATPTGCALPKNIPKLNSARGVAGAGIKTTECVSAIRNTYSVITDESSSESSTNLYVKHPYLKTKLHIESSSENTANENKEPDYPQNKPAGSISHLNKVAHADKETCKCDMKDYSFHQKTLDLSRNPGLVVYGKWTENKNTQVSQSDSESPYKLLSKESSPCVSIKRKRRKKRRLSVEPAVSLFGRERLYSSEDELFTWRQAIDPCFSKDFSWSGLKHQQVKCGFMPPLGQYKLSSSLPAGVEAEEIKMEIPLLSTAHCRQHERIYTQDNFGPTGFTKVWHSAESDVKGDMTKLCGIANGHNAPEQVLTKVKEDMKVKEMHLENVASSKDTYRNKIKSITNAIFQSAELDDPEVAMGRSVRGSSAKSVMREEAETEKVSQCQRATEPHQQLETQYPITYQSCHMVGDMTPPPSETAMSTESVTELLDHTTRHHASQSTNTASKEASAILHNYDRIMNGTVLKTENNAKQDFSPKHEMTTVCESGRAQDKDGENQTECELQAHSESQNLLHTSSSTLSSCYTPEIEPIVQLSNEKIKQRLGNFSMSHDGPKLQEEMEQMIAKNGKINPILDMKCPHLSHDAAEEPCWDQGQVVMTNSQLGENTEPGVKSDHTVFAMSSFWKEMEKLTLNDILGCRHEKKTQSGFLPALQETDDANFFTLSDSGCCSLAEERKLPISDPVGCNLSSVVMASDSSPRGVLWESDPVPMSLPSEESYKDTITVNGITEPIATPGLQGGLRRMSKKISVRNLCALESDSFGCKFNSQSTLKLDRDTCNDIGYIPEDPRPKRDPRPSSMIENFKLSINDIYSYFFSEKQTDSSLELQTEHIVDSCPDADSVPENYDHLFSEFDTDTFFHTDEAKPELVPIFSCSRSSKSKMEFKDAYDYFLVSSSDNSSSESDEEDAQERAPIRVVTRFTRKASSKDIVTDAYEHFYTDRDLKQDFFKTTFSFRNLKLTNDSDHKQGPTHAFTAEPQQQEARSFHIKSAPISVLDNQDVLFADSLLSNFDSQIISKLQQPLIYQSLQTAVANPNLDAPLLPLKQSDMCLICIAFASWVLKTADPQAGDAWKAALLANVSALSAIRYLRRYIKGETTAGEKKPNFKTVC